MPSKAMKLLERMRRSKSGWTVKDLINLYESFGFVVTHGSNHDIVKHPKYSNLRTTLPRHNYLARGYVEYAIKLIDQLLILENQEE
jgi:predicted RNA binding protein YcfA (HicA-like mRNA interferase family)